MSLLQSGFPDMICRHQIDSLFLRGRGHVPSSRARLIGRSVRDAYRQRRQTQQPKPIEKVQGVTGRFQAILTKRSPLSNPSDVAKRISQKPGAEDKDYDLSKEVYEAFVPKSPGDDGKYGLMVPMPFPAHGFPPSNWIDSLRGASSDLAWRFQRG